MPVEYRVLKEGNLVMTVLEGHITAQEMIEHTRAFIGDERIRQGHRELADLSKAETTDIMVNQMDATVNMEQDAEVLRGAKMALFAPTDIQYGMSRMYMALAEETPREAVEVFRDLEQARKWLGVPKDVI